MVMVLCDKFFYDCSGGGLMFFGGELFMQLELVVELFKVSYDVGIYMVVEICLYVLWKYIVFLLFYIDLFLVDLKYVVDGLFKQWIDGSVLWVLENFRKFVDVGKKMVICVLLIQGFNVDEEIIKVIIDFVVDELYVGEIYFLFYYMLGINKYYLFSQFYYVLDKLLDVLVLFDFVQKYVC